MSRLLLLALLSCSTADTGSTLDSAVDSATPIRQVGAAVDWLFLEEPCELGGTAWSVEVPEGAVVLQVLECNVDGCQSYPDYRISYSEGLWVACLVETNVIQVVTVTLAP